MIYSLRQAMECSDCFSALWCSVVWHTLLAPCGAYGASGADLTPIALPLCPEGGYRCGMVLLFLAREDKSASMGQG